MHRISCCCLVLALVALSSAHAQQQTSISGVVTDAEEGFPLVGANVVLLEDGSMVTGAATDADGRYEIRGIQPGTYVLAFRFVGYDEERFDLTLSAGEVRTVAVALTATGFDLNTVVVTASRQAEKVLDAPASISVLGTEEIETAALTSSAAVLRNTVGVDMAQTGIDRYEIVLRGFNNAFSGATYVLTDYRQGAIASLGVNAYQMMPITQIDLERVEVVRGPGSALYGAGVDAGVVHFITKDPFTYPGTTAMVGGGERGTLMTSARHAGVVNDRLGYKVVGSFTRGEEWHFDPNNELDRLQLESFREEALPVDYDTHKYNVNGTLAYRFRPNVTLTANGGFSSSKSIFLSGIGTLQSDGFGYSYGQLRFDAGSFFAQAYVNANNAGESFVYRDTAVDEIVDNSMLFNAQTQYDFGLMDERLRLIVGADYELTAPATERSITGRNESDDQIQEVGAYAQGTARLSSLLDATVAVRADHNNVVDEVQLSPRAALVFKPSAEHSLRATYNRAFSSPGTNSLFLDINAGSAGPLNIRARGAAHGFEFQRDSDFGGLVASSLIPDTFGSDMAVGMPLEVVYRQVYGALAAIPTAQLQTALRQQGIELSEEQVQGLVALLSPEAGTDVTGTTSTELGFLNLTTLTIDRTANDVVDIDPLRQTVSQTFEVGYKGLVGRRLLFAVDAYYVKKRNFVGPLSVESPFVLAPAQARVIADLQGAMAAGIAGNQTLNALLQQLGISSDQAADLIAQLAAPALQQSLPQQGTPIGIVQPTGPGEVAIPGQLLLTYRNFGDVAYHGVDLSTQVIVSDELDLFGNLSWINDNFFDAEELDEEGTTLELAMNAPKIKLKGGFDYSRPQGFRVNASVRHIGGFQVRSGPYEGRIDPYTLLDVGAGYDLGAHVPGLRLDVNVLNLLDVEHREFIGAPQLGRLAIGRLTYAIE